MLRYSLWSLVGAFAAGAALAAGWPSVFPSLLLFALAAGSGVVSILLSLRWPRALAGLLLSVVLLGSLRYQAVERPLERLYRLVPSLTQVTGTVGSYPEMTVDRTVFLLRPASLPAKLRVTYLGSEEEREEIHYGDRLCLLGRAVVPSRSLGFDYRAHLARQGVFAVFTVRAAPGSVEYLGAAGNLLLRAGDRLRQGLLRRLERSVPSSAWGLARGLLFGETRGITQEVEDAFRRTGLFHLLAVSGMHLTILLAGVWVLLRAAGLRPVLAYPLAAAPVLAVLWIVGWPVSLVRAALLFGFIALGSALGDLGIVLRRSVRPHHGLAAAALVVLVVWPSALSDLGFQLSFGATAGILALLVLPRETKSAPRPLLRRASDYLRDVALVSLAAQAGTAPITAARLSVVYPLGVLANLVAVPLSSVAMWAGAVALLLAWTPLLPPAGAVFGLLLLGLRDVVGAMARLPGSTLSASSWFGTWLAGFALYALGVAVWSRPASPAARWHVQAGRGSEPKG